MGFETRAFPATEGLFLGVESSATGRAWRDRLDARGAARALAIAQRYDLPELLARILAGRNVEIDAVEAFLDPTIKRSMPDPHVLTAMPEAAARIADAVQRGETIAIFGDYDVDGATSSALLARFLRQAGNEPMIHIPDRLFEGYGPNVEAMRALAERGATLLVTVDCGTTSIEPLAQAHALGVDVVVVDHHQADEALPPAVAIVNPNRRDDLSGLGHLAAVGLMFMTVVAVNRLLRARGFWTAGRPEPDLLSFLDLVALGTVADVVPLIGLNRAFVAKGLIALRQRDRVGLTRAHGCSAARRTAGSLASRLPARPAHQCRRPHRPRRSGRAAFDRRRSDRGGAHRRRTRPPQSRAAGDRNRRRWRRPKPRPWPRSASRTRAPSSSPPPKAGIPGVVGLVAARLKERFGRPAFAIALEPGGIGTGSGRSIPGVDLGRAVRRAVARRASGQRRRPRHGGRRDLAQGRARAPSAPFSKTRSARRVEIARRDDALMIDGAVSAGGRQRRELVEMIERAGPFGAGNPEPVLALPAHTLAYAEAVGEAHMRARFAPATARFVNAIAFRAAGQQLGARADRQSRPAAMHAAGYLAIDRWQGEERVQFRLSDIAPAEPFAGH